jgi:hypothetical protein
MPFKILTSQRSIDSPPFHTSLLSSEMSATQDRFVTVRTNANDNIQPGSLADKVFARCKELYDDQFFVDWFASIYFVSAGVANSAFQTIRLLLRERAPTIRFTNPQQYAVTFPDRPPLPPSCFGWCPRDIDERAIYLNSDVSH